MTKKIEKPKMSREELNRLIGIYKPDAVTGSDTESTAPTDDGEKRTIPESTLQTNDGEIKTTPETTAESVPEPAKMINDVSAASGSTAPAVSELPRVVTGPVAPELPSAITAPTAQETLRRPSTKQRKASFEEYREAFLQAPKITDRQPVFLSREIRDRIDEIVRRLGDRKMSVSGFIENLARQHLEAYAEDIEVWKRL